MQFLKYPKVGLSILLFLIYLSAFWVYPNTLSIYLFLGSLSFCILSDLAITYIRKRVFFIPYGAIASGLIIGLLIDRNAGLLELFTVCVLAMASKNFLRVSNIQIFNPAGFGLVVGGLIFSLPVSWWGVSFIDIKYQILNIKDIVPFLILISPALVSAYRMRRYLSILAFFITYNLVGQYINSTAVFDPTVLFFGLVMLPEPMSSPFKLKWQLPYGILVGVLAHLLSGGQLASILPDGLLPALLIGNLLFFKFR